MARHIAYAEHDDSQTGRRIGSENLPPQQATWRCLRSRVVNLCGLSRKEALSQNLGYGTDSIEALHESRRIEQWHNYFT